MRAGSKEIVAAMVMLSVSFIAALSPQDYSIIEGGLPMVPKGCPDRCGSLTIFYPFGIGPNKACYLNKWFLINCTESSLGGDQIPYLSSFSPSKGVREILDISLSQQTITVQESISPFSCGPAEAADGTLYSNHTKLYGTPYSYGSPYYNNLFVVLGCGSALMATLPDHNTQGGCTSLCDDHASTHLPQGCYGINCCQFSFTTDSEENKAQGYQVKFTTQTAVANASCNYAFLVEEDYWTAISPNTITSSLVEQRDVPVAWSWDVPLHNIPHSSSSHSCYRSQIDEPNLGSCKCNYPKEGNPYLVNGCQGHHKLTVKELSAIIGVSASFGFLMLLSTSYILYKALRKRQMKKQRQKFFKRNGGLLLEQQLLAKEGTIEKSKIFTASELEKSTNHFNANRTLGRGGQGTVYKGMLVDGQIVAIKKSQAVNEDQLEPFINEVVILSQINHRNVVKLLGCCLETEVPILVYEYIPNGTLFSLIHDNFGEDEQIPLSWDIRLRIASEVANALAYLHFATSIPIYHRDIKSSNILLDDKFRAKVSDFGTSRSISIDQTHLTTIVKGTFGYLDPEYFQSSQFTDKSDVYSFGVVLAELLTGQKPISFLVDIGEDRSLVTRFLLCMEESRLLNILDIEVLEQGRMDDIMAVSLLAKRCLNINGKIRPTMKEVVVELEAIRASHSHYLLYMERLKTDSDVVA